MRSRWIKAILFTLPLLLSGCVSTDNQAGVENKWQGNEDAFLIGQTTQSDVLDLLGPPSQIIQLNKGEAYYYLKEVALGKGYVLIVYNKFSEAIRYERAVFFFDKSGTLEQFSTSDGVN